MFSDPFSSFFFATFCWFLFDENNYFWQLFLFVCLLFLFFEFFCRRTNNNK